ncbi:hypothetical protein [Acidithiobacillus thiooxidans]|uniref:hypothetical protein n=1 Tax=Acidithiobacillus thiooxidans TaxID=930 RepID=UPI0009D9F2FC|nr:hypothetical protein [Acidithiobacillus thiooxidans]
MKIKNLFVYILLIFSVTIIVPNTAFSKTKEQSITLSNLDRIIFTAPWSAKVVSPLGSSLLVIDGLNWIRPPGEKDIFCHTFENGHDLLFSFSGTGGSNGAIQVLALDATRKSAKIIMNSLYRPLAYNNKALELIFGKHSKLFYGHFLWNNHDKKIVLTKNIFFRAT